MNLQEQTLMQVLTTVSCWQIPAYQRPFSWELKQAHAIFSDLASGNKKDKHWVGAILLKKLQP